MNRRELLTSLLVTATAVSIPSLVLAKPYQSYLFSDKVIDGKGFVMETGRARTVDNLTEMAFYIKKVEKKDAEIFVSDPDRHYKDNCHHFSLKEHFSWKTDWDNEDDRKLLFGINVATNKVARISRRGRGNNVIMSSNTYNRIKPHNPEGWQINNKIIIDDKFVTDKEVFTFYKGNNPFDVAGVMFDNGGVYLTKARDKPYTYGVLAYI